MTRLADIAAFGCCLMVGQAVPGDWGFVWEAVGRLGVPVVGFGFMVWWAWKRDQAMTSRIREVEESRVQLLVGTIEKCATAMNRIAEAAPALQCPLKKKEDNG